MASPVPAKSQPLHNFSLPHLKWKNHRKQSPIRHHHHSDHESADVMTNQRKRSSSSSSSRICIKVTSSHVVSTSASEALEDESLQKTWNLRPRRPVMNQNHNNGGLTKIGSSENKSVNGNNNNNNVTNKEVMDCVKGNEKQKFSIALTRDEIEEDIFMLTGMKPARRPKKRPRNVQKQLDTLFPGLWLGSITADSYKLDPVDDGGLFFDCFLVEVRRVVPPGYLLITLLECINVRIIDVLVMVDYLSFDELMSIMNN